MLSGNYLIFAIRCLARRPPIVAPYAAYAAYAPSASLASTGTSRRGEDGIVRTRALDGCTLPC